MLKIHINGMVPLEEKKLRCRIEKQLKGTEYLGTVEVHVVNHFVFVKGKSQPYFRLMAFLTDDAFMDYEDIERRLKVLNINMEILYL